MATKAQKKSQKAKRREKKRQREKQRAKRQGGSSPARRLNVRLNKQKPEAWGSEPAEDVAVFDDAILAQLPTEAQAHAMLVRQGLEEVCNRSGELALEKLSGIPRRSPYADWRLFLRGLVQWNQQQFDSAERFWERLDPSRRPARIARALTMATWNDLPESGTGELKAEDGDVLDSDILYHAKLVRRHQIDRPAVRAAEAITRIPMQAADATVTPQHIEWLRHFTSEHQAIEPDLVQALHEVTLRRAFCGPYIDIFRDAVKYFRGPKHDRKNNLLRFFYERVGPAGKKAERWLDEYLNHDLPNNAELTPDLRAALRSEVFMTMAAGELHAEVPISAMFSPRTRGPNLDTVTGYLNEATKAYPQNRAAWSSHAEFLQERQAIDGLKKSERAALLERRARVHQGWIQALPDDVEPRLALADYLLENDRSDEAKEHVDWLAGTRREDPLADAMTWKFHLLEAMRLCRRKTRTPLALEHLERSETLWPSWLSRDWLPFLKAASHYRAGEASAFEAAESASQQAGDVTLACMKLGAAQRMRVPSTDLKPLRKPVDAAVANLAKVATEDLFHLAGFFWDLHRTRLTYPAYRMHGTKFLAELAKRIDRQPSLVLDDVDAPRVRAALLILASEGSYNNAYNFRPPHWLADHICDHPALAATAIVSLLRQRMDVFLCKYSHLAELLEEAAGTQDVFHRHYYHKLADQLRERIRDSGPSPFHGFFDMLEDILERASQE